MREKRKTKDSSLQMNWCSFASMYPSWKQQKLQRGATEAKLSTELKKFQALYDLAVAMTAALSLNEGTPHSGD